MKLNSNLVLFRVLRTIVHNQSQPPVCFENKALSEHSDTICLNTFYGCCRLQRQNWIAATAEYLRMILQRKNKHTSCLSDYTIHWTWDPQNCHFGGYFNYKKERKRWHQQWEEHSTLSLAIGIQVSILSESSLGKVTRKPFPNLLNKATLS